MVLNRVERKTLHYMKHNRLLPDRAGVIVGLSGGPDSVALLRLLHSLNAAGDIRVALAALHLNHLLRGRQARADEKFCVNLCKTLGVPIAVKRLNVKRFARLHRLSTEEAARRLRYDIFRAAARKAPHTRIVIALGHHAGDQAETVLQRIIRGTGIAGLAGIPVKRPLDLGTPGKTAMIVRPLLAARRDEILAYLAEIGQPSRTDTTNLGVRFTRNRLRNRLLPLLRREFNPSVDDALIRLADIARQWSAALKKQLPPENDIARTASSWKRTGALSIPLPLLAAGPPARAQALLAKTLQSAAIPLKNMTRRHYDAIIELARTAAIGRQLRLPGITALKEHDAVRLQRKTPRPPRPKPTRKIFNLPLNGRVKLPGGPKISCRETRRRLAPSECNGLREVIDMDAVKPPLIVRFPRPGDIFRPLGAPGTKKILHLLAQRKVPPEKRSRVPLVADKNGILWVVGHRIDDRVKTTPLTRRMLLLQYFRG